MKAFKNPPPLVIDVASVFLSVYTNSIVRVDDKTWDTFKKACANPLDFVKMLKNIDSNLQLDTKVINFVEKSMKNELFKEEEIARRSAATCTIFCWTRDSFEAMKIKK